MAQGKKDGGKASQKRKAAEKASEEASSKAVEATEAAEEKAADSHGDDHVKSAKSASEAVAHGHGDQPHDHAPNRKEYFYVFLVLGVLTLLEVGVAQVPGISKVTAGVVLVALAITKAATVGLYYMHLKHETRIMRLTVAIPMAAPAVYALVLISEGAWRLAR